MLGNGDSQDPPDAKDPGVPEEAAKGAAIADAPAPENTSITKNGVMTITLYLERSASGYAEAMGSLVLAQDIVRNYFTQKAMYEQALKARGSGIIRPGLAH